MGGLEMTSVTLPAAADWPPRARLSAPHAVMLPMQRPLQRRNHLCSSVHWLAPYYPITAHGWTVSAAVAASCSLHSVNGVASRRATTSALGPAAGQHTRLPQILYVLFRVFAIRRCSKRTLRAPTGALGDAASPAGTGDARGGGVEGGKVSGGAPAALCSC